VNAFYSANSANRERFAGGGIKDHVVKHLEVRDRLGRTKGRVCRRRGERVDVPGLQLEALGESQ